jgi:hypothetical protein
MLKDWREKGLNLHLHSTGQNKVLATFKQLRRRPHKSGEEICFNLVGLPYLCDLAIDASYFTLSLSWPYTSRNADLQHFHYPLVSYRLERTAYNPLISYGDFLLPYSTLQSHHLNHFYRQLEWWFQPVWYGSWEHWNHLEWSLGWWRGEGKVCTCDVHNCYVEVLNLTGINGNLANSFCFAKSQGCKCTTSSFSGSFIWWFLYFLFQNYPCRMGVEWGRFSALYSVRFIVASLYCAPSSTRWLSDHWYLSLMLCLTWNCFYCFLGRAYVFCKNEGSRG